jgi:hypothetical protein
MKSQLNWTNKIIEIQIIISIVRVTEHFSKMLVLSGVFNTRILDAMNYANQDRQQIKKTSHVFAWIWPNNDRWLVNHCAMPSIGQTWVLASIGAVVEMGVLSTLKWLLRYGVLTVTWRCECCHQILLFSKVVFSSFLSQNNPLVLVGF